jgi:hypothetical protein
MKLTKREVELTDHLASEGVTERGKLKPQRMLMQEEIDHRKSDRKLYGATGAASFLGYQGLNISGLVGYPGIRHFVYSMDPTLGMITDALYLTWQAGVIAHIALTTKRVNYLEGRMDESANLESKVVNATPG